MTQTTKRRRKKADGLGFRVEGMLTIPGSSEISTSPQARSQNGIPTSSSLMFGAFSFGGVDLYGLGLRRLGAWGFSV